VSAVSVTWAAPAAGGSSLAPTLSLRQLSLEDLMRIEVSTVSRKAEPWWGAPGAIDVVTDDDIRRSGAMNIPDALRLATGVHVGQANAREWAIGIRGFNVNASNKLNVQLDGRSLFTPFFSGVLWDAQDTLMEDIARIEVMRGPAGALWGSYALNGFIQILTKPAWETQGWLASVGGGNDSPGFGSFRYGGKLSGTSFYRVYAKYAQHKWTYTPGGGGRAQSTTDFAQAGFRSDTRAADGSTLTLHGDAYTNKGTPKDHPQNEVSGANLTGHWHKPLALDSDLRATAYYDFTSKAFADPFQEKRHTFSGSLKYHLMRGRHDVQVGAEGLVSRDNIRGGIVFLEPAKRTYYSSSVFAHDSMALVPRRWSLILGAQALYTNFSDVDVQPTMRVLWTPSSHTTMWGAVSRAVRTPVRLDLDLVAQFDTVRAFEGNENLKSETVLAWELGFRHRFGERLAFALASFLNDYNDVRSYESATTTFRALPWTFKNTTNVQSSGFELMMLAQPMSRLFIKAGYRYLDFNLTKDPGSGDFQNGFYEANDARHVANITARFDLGREVDFDVMLRHASSLPNPPMHAFTTADARLAWAPNADWELALIARNLFDPRHPEFTTANHPNDELGRSVTLKATWRF
jgi:iron complex outermembrane recepter protein